MKHRLIPKQWTAFTHIRIDKRNRQKISRLFAVSNDWMLVNNQLDTMCKEVVVAYFIILYRNLPGETEGGGCPSRD